MYSKVKTRTRFYKLDESWFISNSSKWFMDEYPIQLKETNLDKRKKKKKLLQNSSSSIQLFF